MKKTNETGRSMVEMLGVLAIIGVLSIGGIAGYTMAMNKYQANEIVNSIVQAAIYCRTKNIINATTDIKGKVDADANIFDHIYCTDVTDGTVAFAFKDVNEDVKKAACKGLGQSDGCTTYTPVS